MHTFQHYGKACSRNLFLVKKFDVRHKFLVTFAKTHPWLLWTIPSLIEPHSETLGGDNPPPFSASIRTPVRHLEFLFEKVDLVPVIRLLSLALGKALLKRLQLCCHWRCLFDTIVQDFLKTFQLCTSEHLTLFPLYIFHCCWTNFLGTSHRICTTNDFRGPWGLHLGTIVIIVPFCYQVVTSIAIPAHAAWTRRMNMSRKHAM